ncbi:MAG: Membrane protein insertase YidC [Paracidovorax wautersii]|uniref:Membrane protein insertase YidC n=1 Tax=Paracidovorax wautersii TaxID=1177982 RepID=A0A7V8FPL6_9BURK|nr:MAG: Membrane protein insertase YidC [Paracidovorax wautersii]
MNDIRRTILWVIFCFSLILLWDQWQVHNGRKATFFPRAEDVTATANAAATPAGATTPATVPPSTDTPAAGGAASVPGQQQPAAEVRREQVEVNTDVLRVTFDTEGGSVARTALLHYSDQLGGSEPVVLLDENAHRVYQAQTGLIGGNFPTHKTPMALVAGPHTLAEGQNELKVTFESADLGGLKLRKIYTLRRGDYAIGVRHEIVNTGSTAVSPQLYLQIVRDGNALPSTTPFGFAATFTGPAVYDAETKFKKIEFKDIEAGKVQTPAPANDGFVAMVQHYFASAWILGDNVRRDFFTRKVGTNLYAVGMIAPLDALQLGETRAIDATFFTGPQLEKTLESLAPGLELVKDYGWLTILAKPLYWLVDKLHSILGNWGWAIVALVVLLKAAFFWLNAKAYSSMAKMKAINPRVQELRERLKDKPQQMQQEMMRIYKEEKVNPLGGCLPIVIQIPVFIALYWVLLSSVEFRQAPWILWIHDLSVPDPFYILPLLMTGSTLLQTWLNPTPPDPMQARLMWIMPLVFSVMFFFFPAGLVLYWLTNNILSIAQQWVINKRLGVA